jgi:hypothetical protein
MQARAPEHDPEKCLAVFRKDHAQTTKRATPHSHEGQTRNRFCEGLWSALQTHLQGVHGATLAERPEKNCHRAALLSRSSGVKLTRPAEEGKPKHPHLKSRGNRAARLR